MKYGCRSSDEEESSLEVNSASSWTILNDSFDQLKAEDGELVLEPKAEDSNREETEENMNLTELFTKEYGSGCEDCISIVGSKKEKKLKKKRECIREEPKLTVKMLVLTLLSALVVHCLKLPKGKDYKIPDRIHSTLDKNLPGIEECVALVRNEPYIMRNSKYCKKSPLAYKYCCRKCRCLDQSKRTVEEVVANSTAKAEKVEKTSLSLRPEKIAKLCNDFEQGPEKMPEKPAEGIVKIIIDEYEGKSKAKQAGKVKSDIMKWEQKTGGKLKRKRAKQSPQVVVAPEKAVAESKLHINETEFRSQYLQELMDHMKSTVFNSSIQETSLQTEVNKALVHISTEISVLRQKYDCLVLLRDQVSAGPTVKNQDANSTATISRKILDEIIGNASIKEFYNRTKSFSIEAGHIGNAAVVESARIKAIDAPKEEKEDKTEDAARPQEVVVNETLAQQLFERKAQKKKLNNDMELRYGQEKMMRNSPDKAWTNRRVQKASTLQ